MTRDEAEKKLRDLVTLTGHACAGPMTEAVRDGYAKLKNDLIAALTAPEPNQPEGPGDYVLTRINITEEVFTVYDANHDGYDTGDESVDLWACNDDHNGPIDAFTGHWRRIE